MARHAHVVVLAGPNGAGASTCAPSLLRGRLAVEEFVNADTIARGLSAFAPERAAVAAGRVMTVRRRYARGVENFLRVYRAIATTWRLYDNSGPRPRLVARGGGAQRERVLDGPSGSG